MQKDVLIVFRQDPNNCLYIPVRRQYVNNLRHMRHYHDGTYFNGLFLQA